jgi:hypothetical protein
VLKQLRREADHSPPTGAEVKKMLVHASTPPYVRENFTFPPPHFSFSSAVYLVHSFHPCGLNILIILNEELIL